jgi:RimJ/RimL family protein N-acetyltransferase
VEANAAVHVSLSEISSGLQAALAKVIAEWSRFRDANLVLSDGRGVLRVVYEIEQLLGDSEKSVFLQYATEDDIELIYEWQSHPDTRKYALEKEVPTWVEHREWMSDKLRSKSDYYYMVIHRADERRVGAVRLDRIRLGNYLVSIFVDPKSYGQGVAYQALTAIDAIHPDLNLHATVLKENFASQRLFTKAGYERVNEESFIRKSIN